MAFLEWTLYGNPVSRWLAAVAVALIFLLAVALVKVIARRYLSRLAHLTPTRADDMILAVLEATRRWLLLFPAAYVGSNLIELPAGVTRILHGLTVVALFLQAGLWGSVALQFSLARYLERRAQTDASTATTLRFMGLIGRLVLWVVLLLLAIDNLGIDITALVAGLGVGGVAVALATQNILGDLFASLSIVLDKPFVIGDFIVVGDMMGTVEQIGIKTTRLRSLSGEQLVLANSDLLGSRIRNYQKMRDRRVVFGFGVTYQTPPGKVAAIPAMVRKIVEGQPSIRFDRAHCTKFGESSLDFEVVYYVLSPDFNLAMDLQQAIHLAMLEQFAGAGIEFAYPTRTVLVQGDAGVNAPPPAAGYEHP